MESAMTELSREARALLAAARRLERTSDDERVRIRSKLSRRLAAGLAMGTAVTASATVAEAAHVGAWTTAVAWLPGVAKIASVAVIAGAVGVGTVHLAQTGSIVGSSKSHVVTANPQTRAAPAIRNAAIEAAPVASAVSKVPAVPTQVSVPEPHEESVFQPTPSVATKSMPRESNQRQTVEQEHETLVQERAAAPEPSRVVSSPTPVSNSLSSQVSAMREARADIRNGNALAALAALDRQFPPGQDSSLLPEATLARIAALCALGNSAGARQLADEFLSRFPGSTLASRVRASCAYTVTNGP
jgi:hypothetical protein